MDNLRTVTILVIFITSILSLNILFNTVGRGIATMLSLFGVVFFMSVCVLYSSDPQ
jgi:hypothetical protein